mmetsp:Transcript_30515/g.35804  ORF Transcript_30515/g.35804 Transcript_30515/m.35804 type:complete len:106 (+) Transcript_30515:358-675(+)
MERVNFSFYCLDMLDFTVPGGYKDTNCVEFSKRASASQGTSKSLANRALALAKAERVSLMGAAAAEEPAGFDWAATTIGASIGFVAAFALCKASSSKNDDQFKRI